MPLSQQQPVPRVAWLSIEPLAYQLALMGALRRLTPVELHCFFLDSATEGPLLEDYRELAEPEPSGGLEGRRMRAARILRSIATGHWEAVVLAGYSRRLMQVAMLICLARRIPFLVHSDTHLLRPRPWLTRAAKRAFLFPLLRHCGAAMGFGVLQRRYFEYLGVPPGRIFSVPPVAHLAELGRQVEAGRSDRWEVRERLAIPPDALLALYVGRLSPEKGVDLLIDGLAATGQQRRPHLLVVGDGPLRPLLEASAARGGLPVRFVGAIPNNGLGRLYAAADVFVLPSRAEGWGIAVAEAMVAGLPVVLSDQVGAAHDLLEHEANGLLVSAGSAETWSAALARCVAWQARLPGWGQRSREIISSWTTERAADEFLAALAAAQQSRKTKWISL